MPYTKNIAIVGMSCRFPGANNLESFWDLLSNGKNMITEIGDDRWDLESFFDPNPSTPNIVEKEDNVFPMIPSGASVSDIRLK